MNHYFLKGEGGVGLENFRQKVPIQQIKTAEKKKRAFYYTGPVFDFKKNSSTSYCTGNKIMYNKKKIQAPEN